MSYDLTPLLLHSDEVPPEAKVALLAAGRVGDEERERLLESAARAIYRGAPVGCSDARELVGLPPGSCS